MNKLTTEGFIKKAINIHGDEYDYSSVNYINSRTNIDIICKKHGIFSQNPRNHIGSKSKCPECSNENLSTKFSLDDMNFIVRANNIHKNKYNYSLVKYINQHKKVIILCPIHGIFEQQPLNHLSGQGCPICRESKGEKEVARILKKLNIDFIRQKTFPDLKDVSNLYYDFYIPDHNLFIEYHGIQHIKPVEFFGGKDGLRSTMKRDMIKYEYAINNGYKIATIFNIPPKFLEEAIIEKFKYNKII